MYYTRLPVVEGITTHSRANSNVSEDAKWQANVSLRRELHVSSEAMLNSLHSLICLRTAAILAARSQHTDIGASKNTDGIGWQYGSAYVHQDI